jgi:hypothetical protein
MVVTPLLGRGRSGVGAKSSNAVRNRFLLLPLLRRRGQKPRAQQLNIAQWDVGAHRR